MTDVKSSQHYKKYESKNNDSNFRKIFEKSFPLEVHEITGLVNSICGYSHAHASQSNDQEYVRECCYHEMEKVRVIQFANTSSKPHAVMVESHHTVVAIMTMGSPKGPKYVAAFTILHFVYECVSRNCCVCLPVYIKHFLLKVLQFMILLIHLLQCIFIKIVFGDNSRV